MDLQQDALDFIATQAKVLRVKQGKYYDGRSQRKIEDLKAELEDRFPDVAITKAAYEDALIKAVELATQEAQGEPKIVMGHERFSDVDKEITKGLKIYVEKSLIKHYYKTAEQSETYNLVHTEAKKDQFYSALTGMGEDVYQKRLEVYESVKAAYKKGVLNEFELREELGWVGKNELTGVLKPLEFKEYLNKLEEIAVAEPTMRFKRMPEVISNDPQEPANWHFDLNTIPTQGKWYGLPRNWRGWMLNIPKHSRGFFMAWVYSIFNAKNKGRQILYLRDGGYSGKSAVGNALADFIGRDRVAVFNPKGINQFSGSIFHEKRLAVCLDSKNQNFLHDGFIHGLSAGDTQGVEYKGKTQISAKLYCKILVASNDAIEVLNQDNEESRIGYIAMKKAKPHILKRYFKVNANGELAKDRDGDYIRKGNNDFEGALIAELPEFLHYCKLAYEKLCPSDMDVEIPYEMKQLIRDSCVAKETMLFDKVIDKQLEFDPAYKVLGYELKDCVVECLGRDYSDFVFSALTKHLEKKYSVKRGQPVFPDGKRKSAYIGVRIKVSNYCGVHGQQIDKTQENCETQIETNFELET